MKKQITTAFIGILMLASAMALYSGESYTFSVGELTNPVYTVVGNNSNLDGLGVIFENRNITITTSPLMGSDNFTLIFFDEVTKEVVRTISSGGGGGGGSSSITKYVDRNVTVYVPEYINTTEVVEKEITVWKENVQVGYKLWQVIVAMVLVAVMMIVIRMFNRREEEEIPREEQ